VKVQYFPSDDMLYKVLADRPSTESEEIAPGVVADFDAEGKVIGLEFEHASQRFDLQALEADVERERVALVRFAPSPVHLG